MGCARCCLRDSMRVINLIMLLLGIGMIIYSLWLQKKWYYGISDLPLASSFPKPLFLGACLGVAIVVCLSTVSGHMVASSISNSILCIYIVGISCLLLIEVAVIVAFLFKINWEKQLAAYIPEDHKEFEGFVLFNVKMCRIISLLVLAPQVTVVIICAILRAVGAKPRTHCLEPNIAPQFAQSFLVPNSPGPDSSPSACRKCDNLSQLSRRRSSFMSFIWGLIARLLQRTNLN